MKPLDSPDVLEAGRDPAALPGAELGVAPADETAVTDSAPLSLSLLLRHKWLILGVFVAVVVPGLAYVWTQVEPTYRATAVIRVAPRIPRIVFKTEDNGIIPLYQSYLNTQVAVILSSQVLERVLDQPDVRATRWYAEHKDAPLAWLSESLYVVPRRRTELIDVSFTAKDPREAALIANAVVDQYIRYVNQRSSLADDPVYQTLVDRYRQLQREIEGRKEYLNKLRRELGTGTPEQLVAQKRVRLDQTQAELNRLEQQIRLKEWEKSELERLSQTRAPSSQPATQSAGFDQRYQRDDEWRRLYLGVRRAEHRLELARQRLGDENPRLLQLQQDLEFARDLLRNREAELDQQWRLAPPDLAGPQENGFARDARELDWQIRALKKQRDLVLETLRKQQDDFDQTFEKAQLLARENDELSHKLEMYAALRQRKDAKELESNVPGSISLQTRAIAPHRPHRDRRKLMSAVILVVGLGLGVGAAYLRATLNPRIHEADDLPLAGPTPFLGHLPLVRDPERISAQEERRLAECMRMIRTSLLQRLPGGRGVVLVSSAGPGAGKTAVAMLLARSLAQAGKRVLLVDADIRRPSLATRFNLPAGPGLLDMLARKAREQDVIRTNGQPGLSIVPAGDLYGGGFEPELLANGEMGRSLKRWREAYDVVVLDAPPVLPVADARILAPMADGVLMVVREKHCHRDEVVEAIACIGAAGGRLLGTVFLGDRGRRAYASRYSKYYGQYNAYLEAPQPTASSAEAPETSTQSRS